VEVGDGQIGERGFVGYVERPAEIGSGATEQINAAKSRVRV
jgi:hypothetical protein